MRLVVLDTNVLVSAGIKLDSAPYRIAHDWVMTGEVQIVTCPSICQEYREVNSSPKFSHYGFPPAWLEFLIESSMQMADPAPWPHPLPSESDSVFLALAAHSGAWLISGNLRHYPPASSGSVTVCPPSEYLRVLQGK